jgi:biopolymer transport protein ExbD
MRKTRLAPGCGTNGFTWGGSHPSYAGSLAPPSASFWPAPLTGGEAQEWVMPPNPRLQRTRSASPPSPLSRQPLGARMVVVGLSVVLMLACSRQNSQESSGPIAKVHVQADGTILLNGQPTSMEKLKSELETLKARGGTVWYSRANPSGDPPPHAMEVMEAIANAGIPVSLMEKPQ